MAVTLQRRAELDKDDSATWDNYDLYLARDLPPMRAQMELGQVTSRSEVLDSIGIKGIHLYNDKRMIRMMVATFPSSTAWPTVMPKLPYDSSRASSMKPPFPQVLLL